MADMTKGRVAVSCLEGEEATPQQSAPRKRASIFQLLLTIFMLAIICACIFLLIKVKPWESTSGGTKYYNPQKDYFFKAYKALEKSDLPLQAFHRIQKYVEEVGDGIPADKRAELDKELRKIKVDIMAVVDEISKLQNEFENIEIKKKDGSTDKIGGKTEFSQKMEDIKNNQERGLSFEIRRINELLGRL